MIKVLIIAFSGLILTSCNYYSAPSEQWLIDQVQTNYNNHAWSDNPGVKCLSSPDLVPAGVDRKIFIRSSCNSDINILQGDIKYSDFKVYRHKDHSSICGVASGLTSFKQKTGIRMIVSDKDLKNFTWKRARYDFAYLSYSNKELKKSMRAIMDEELKHYSEVERIECHNDKT